MYLICCSCYYLSSCSVLWRRFFFVVCFFFSSRRRHTRCALVTGVQTCALPISSMAATVSPATATLARVTRWIRAIMGKHLERPARRQQCGCSADQLSPRRQEREGIHQYPEESTRRLGQSRRS